MLSETISGWFDEAEQKGMEKGRLEMLGEQRLMFKKLIAAHFGASTAESAWELLQKVKSSELFTQIAECLFNSQTPEQLLESIRKLLAQKQ